MKISKISAISVLMASLTVVSLLGSGLGTLAWYAYSTRAKIEMNGTAVQSTQQLQIGIYCRDYGRTWEGEDYSIFDGTLETPNATYGTYMEQLGADHYIWMPAGQGFNEQTINKYLELNGCASEELTPTSTRTFDKGDGMHLRLDDKGNANPSDDEYVSCGIDEGEIQLFDSLNAGDPVNAMRARKGSYIELPLAFRIISYEGIVQSFAENKDIWLTDVTSSAMPVLNQETMKYETRAADKALRIHAHNKNAADGQEKDLTINPAIKEDGENTLTYEQQFTYVAGLLNLKKSGHYDTDIKGKEILYGDFAAVGNTEEDKQAWLKDHLSTVTCKDEPGEGEYDASGWEINDVRNNVNGVTKEADGTHDITDESNPSSFLAHHRNGTKGYLNFLDKETGVDLRNKAHYYSLYDIAPTVSGQGDYSAGHPVGRTLANENKNLRIARTDLTIWLEGWDHSIVDNNIGTKFNLGLTFEINRV